jgi:hypothetical protein
MRRYIVLFIALITTLWTACGSRDSGVELRDTPPDVKLYAPKQLKIEYEYSGAARGSKTHILANHGMYQRMEDELTYTLDGAERTVGNLDIINDTVQYHIDLLEKRGTRSSFDPTRLNKLVEGYTEQELENFQQSYLLRSGAKMIGTETILGKECTVFELTMSGVVVSMWNSVTMRSRITMGDGEVIMTAVRIDENFKPTPGMFTPPTDVKITPPRVISDLPEGHPPVEVPDDTQAP